MDAPNLDALTRDALDYYLFPLATKQDMRTDGPMIFSSAEGMEITDAGGKTYLDMMSTQTRASSLGYGQERIARAIYDQLMSLHYAGTFANVADTTIRLSAKIGRSRARLADCDGVRRQRVGGERDVDQARQAVSRSQRRQATCRTRSSRAGTPITAPPWA